MEIEESDLEGQIIDRSGTPEEINTQIDVSADEFQKLEFPRESGEQLYGGEEDVLPGEEVMGNPLLERMAVGSPKRVERPKMKRREKASPLEVELDSSGKLSMGNMLRASLGNTKESHLVISDDFEQREDVKLYSRLPDYNASKRYDLGKDDLLRQVAQRIYANFHKPTWRTLKHHLFSVRAPKKLSR